MFILFDIGGTKMRMAASRDGNTFEEPVVSSTPKRFTDGIKLFMEIAQELVQGEKIHAAAGGIAGPFNREKTQIVNSPNLPDWSDKPFKIDLQQLLDAPVYMENDAATVGIGEAVYGAGKGYDIMAYITVSTGVGGARIVRGKVDENVIGFEPGHQIIDADGSMQSNFKNEKGTLEDYISGAALERRYGKKPYELADPQLWDAEARLLAYGLYNTILHWSPHAVVLGGPMVVGNPAISVDRVREYLKTIFPLSPPVEQATLQDRGGLWGALELLKQKAGG